jgi:hypothetical protein
MRLLRTLKVLWILLCSVFFVRLLCTLKDLARLLCSACFVHLLPGGALNPNSARLLLHIQTLAEITLQCLLCSSFTWQGFILEFSEASFAHLKSWRAYFARLALLGEPLYFNSANFVRLLCTLEVLWILLCSVFFVRLLRTLEDLARLLCSACFVHLHLAGLYIPTLRGFFCTFKLLPRLHCNACFVHLLLGKASYFNLARLLLLT